VLVFFPRIKGNDWRMCACNSACNSVLVQTHKH
jgi:hypothetical protein